MENNLQTMITNKKFVIFMAVLSVLLLILIPLATIPNIVPSTTVPQPDQESQTFTQSESFNFNQTEQSPEVLQAIEEQKAADQSYDSWQDGNRELYSWIRKLPLSATNYFVYFDLNREVFIGRLYPAPGEDTERLKSDILNTLKLEKEIPVENFKFEWLVNP